MIDWMKLTNRLAQACEINHYHAAADVQYAITHTEGDDEAAKLVEEWITARLIERGKREIMEDVKSGRVPRTVASFSELHDYVDANEYGGICDDEIVDGLSNEDFLALGNTVQDALDLWVKSGALTAGA